MSDRQPNLFAMALERITLVEPYSELCEATWPGILRKMAVAELGRQGVKLVGDPSLVEHAVADMARQIASILDKQVADFDRPTAARAGRPRVSVEARVIMTAAFYRFDLKQLGRRQALDRAVAFLGGRKVVTRNQIEKAELAFRRAPYGMPDEPPEKKTERAVRFLFHVTKVLDECQAELLRMKNARRDRLHC